MYNLMLTLPNRQYSSYSEVQVLFRTPKELTFRNSSDINSSEQKCDLQEIQINV